MAEYSSYKYNAIAGVKFCVDREAKNTSQMMSKQ